MSQTAILKGLPQVKVLNPPSIRTAAFSRWNPQLPQHGRIETKGQLFLCPEPASKSVLLEPIMKVEVVTPQDYSGSVIGDLNSRRGQIQGQDMRGNTNVIDAMVPLMDMFGYVNKLRLLSQGRATFTMQFDHYAPAPSLPDNDPPFRPALGMRA